MEDRAEDPAHQADDPLRSSCRRRCGSPSSYFDTGLIAANGTIAPVVHRARELDPAGAGRAGRSRAGAVLRLLAVAGLAVLPMLAASPAQAGKQMEVALQDDGVFLYEEHYDRDLAYRQLRAPRGDAPADEHPLVAGRSRRPAHPDAPFRPTSPTTGASGTTRSPRRRPSASRCSSTSTGDPPAWACGNLRPPYACDGYKPNRELFAHFVGGRRLALQGEGEPLLDVERAELVHVDQPAQESPTPVPQALPGRVTRRPRRPTRGPRSSWASWRRTSSRTSRCRRSSSSARWSV